MPRRCARRARTDPRPRLAAAGRPRRRGTGSCRQARAASGRRSRRRAVPRGSRARLQCASRNGPRAAAESRPWRMKLLGGCESALSVRPPWEHLFVTHPAYIREKARQMRTEKDLTIDEIAERLAISRQTIFYWVKDVPLKKPRRASLGRRLGNEAMQLKYKRLRDAAYEQGRAEFHLLTKLPGFRDFVCMYIGEGYKRNRNIVQICNSDLNVVLLGDHWIRRFATNPVTYSVQYHEDPDITEIQRV